MRFAPLLAAALVLLSGLTVQLTSHEALGAGDTHDGPWTHTLNESSLLVRVEANDNWTIQGTGDLPPEGGHSAGIHRVGDGLGMCSSCSFPARFDVQVMTGDHQVWMPLPNPFMNLPDKWMGTRTYPAGETHLVLWSHRLTSDFTIEGAEVTVLAEDRDMVRVRDSMDGEWDYNLHIHIPSTIKYFDATARIVTQHGHVAVYGTATTFNSTPHPWQVTTRIGSKECHGAMSATGTLMLRHHGTGDLFVDAFMEHPDRWGYLTLYIYDLPLPPPEPLCPEYWPWP